MLPEPALLVLTGASGWFGRAFLHAIATDQAGLGALATNGEVRVLVPSPEDVRTVLDVLPSARVHLGDVTEPSSLERVFRNAAEATVVHAAGVIHPRRVAEFDRVNSAGTSAVLDAAEHAGVRRLVHVSSNSPFGVNAVRSDTFRHDEPYDPYLGYGRSKMMAELAVRAAHREGRLESVVVRPPWFYGPFQPLRQTTFFSLVRAGRFPLLGDGTQRRSMVHTDNLVQGVARAMRVRAAAGGAFWVADARPYEMREVVDTVKRALREEGYDVSPRQLHLPSAVGRVAERLDRTAQQHGLYQRELHVLGESDKTIACDITRTREVLGYQPAIELLEGMRGSIRWCAEQGVAL
jgi:nucleoside-diphosphate-sugar epimerase